MSALPYELWYRIFRLATEFPGALNLDPIASPPDRDRLWLEDYDTSVRKFFGLHSSVLNTKKAIVKVCRLWNEVGKKYLYEIIVLRDRDTATLLAKTVSQTGLGKHVLRLDVAVNVHERPFMGDPELTDYHFRYNSPLHEIFMRCPNLSIITVENLLWAIPPPSSTDVVESDDVVEWFPSLKRLSWSGNVERTVAASVAQKWASRMAPRLEVLCLSGYPNDSVWCGVSLPCVHTALVHPDKSVVQGSDSDLLLCAPRLRMLACESFASVSCIVPIEPHLDSLSVILLPSQDSMDGRASTTDRTIIVTPAPTAELPSSVKEVLLRPRLVPSLRSPCRVEVIGLVVDDLTVLRDQLKHLVGMHHHLPELTSIKLFLSYPKIRIDSWDGVKDSRLYWVFFMHWQDLWSSRGVTLNDELGQPISSHLVNPSARPLEQGEYRRLWEPAPAGPPVYAVGFLGWL